MDMNRTNEIYNETEKLLNLLDREGLIESLKGIEEDAVWIGTELRRICEVLQYLDQAHPIRDEILSVLRDVATEACGVIETITVKSGYKRLGANRGCNDCVRVNHPYRTRHRLSKQMKHIKSKLQDAGKRIQPSGINIDSHHVDNNHSYRDYIFGSDGHENAIVKRLVSGSAHNDHNSRSPPIICITGERGIGKTTLALLVYNNHDVRKHFSFQAWACIALENDDEKFGLRSVFESLMHGIGEEISGSEIEFMRQKVSNILAGKRYLVVLDNVPAVGVIWDIVEQAFPADLGSYGSAILLTTSDPRVVTRTEIHPQAIAYPLPPLRIQDSVKLFNAIFFGHSRHYPTSSEVEQDSNTFKEQVVQICQGNPLLVGQVARRIRARCRDPEWSMEQIDLHLNEISRDLKLPVYLRKCFRYFSLFPKNYDIPARRLIALWISEGLVKPSAEEPPESVGERYLNELIYQRMVQVSKRRLNGKVKTCQLAGKFKRLWRQEMQNSQGTCTLLHFADHCDMKDPYNSVIHAKNDSYDPSLLPHFKETLLFLSFDRREGSKPGEEVGNFLAKCIKSKCFQRLRVLDLERVFRPNLPDKLGEFVKLTYLGLRSTWLDTLPPSIRNLLMLQMLDLKHTYISTLPHGIWKMQQLRHLYLSETYRTRFLPRPSGGSLKELQTLWGVFVNEESPVKGGIDTSQKIRKLAVSCRMMLADERRMLEQLNALFDWIVRLKDLESLRLKSFDAEELPWRLPLKPLIENKNLSSLYLLGKLNGGMFVSSWLPASLTELTLSASELEVDPMSILKRLNKLKLLQLFAKSYTGEKITCSEGGFHELEILKLWNLERLKEWEVKQDALPKLRDLEVRSCKELKEFPVGLKQVSTLETFKVHDMAEGFEKQRDHILGLARKHCSKRIAIGDD